MRPRHKPTPEKFRATQKRGAFKSAQSTRENKLRESGAYEYKREKFRIKAEDSE